MQFLLSAMLAVGLFSNSCMAYIVDGSRVNQPRLLAFAKAKLKNEGVIQATANGGTCLKVDDQYLHALIRQVKAQGFEIPKAGALIDFIAPDEGRALSGVAELGTTIRFEPLGFYTFVQDDQEYFMLAVEAPELSHLRLKYGLSEKLSNHEFNLIVGVRTISAHNELDD